MVFTPLPLSQTIAFFDPIPPRGAWHTSWTAWMASENVT